MLKIEPDYEVEVEFSYCAACGELTDNGSYCRFCMMVYEQENLADGYNRWGDPFIFPESEGDTE